jgi:hypothetical protein
MRAIATREVGEGGVWRMIDGEPVPVSVLMCHQGRSPHMTRPAPQLGRLEPVDNAVCRTSDSKRISNTQLIINDLPVLQVL